MQGIWVNLGQYRYVYQYSKQYQLEYSSIWVPPVSTWVLRVLPEYLSTQVLSLGLVSKLKL